MGYKEETPLSLYFITEIYIYLYIYFFFFCDCCLNFFVVIFLYIMQTPLPQPVLHGDQMWNYWCLFTERFPERYCFHKFLQEPHQLLVHYCLHAQTSEEPFCKEAVV